MEDLSIATLDKQSAKIKLLEERIQYLERSYHLQLPAYVDLKTACLFKGANYATTRIRKLQQPYFGWSNKSASFTYADDFGKKGVVYPKQAILNWVDVWSEEDLARYADHLLTEITFEGNEVLRSGIIFNLMQERKKERWPSLLEEVLIKHHIIKK